MAAVVCQSMARMTGILCSYMGDLCTICASGFKQVSAILLHCLSEYCATVLVMCKKVFKLLRAMVVSPFFPYLAVTYCLNLPPFFYGMKSIFNNNCGSSWLFLNTFLTAMHIITGTYMVVRIRIKNPDQLSKESPNTLAKTICLDPEICDDDFEIVNETMYVQTEDNGGVNNDGNVNEAKTKEKKVGVPDSWERIRYVMCYDMVMAGYYALFLFWILWQSIGTKTILNNEHDDDCGRYLVLSVVYGFLYMGLVIVALICSICQLRFKALSQKLENQQPTQTVEEVIEEVEKNKEIN